MLINTRVTKRIGVAQVLAELIPLSVTLILGVSITGYVFGEIGYFTHPAEVAVQSSLCARGGQELVCTLNLANYGAESVSTTSLCIMKVGGSSFVGSTEPTIVRAGSQAVVRCSANVGAVSTSTRVTGSVILANGAQTYYAAA